MSPRTPLQLEAIKNESKDKILQAALELFGRQGFHKTTIEEVARKAGVAKGLIYNYFERKEDLVYGIFAQAVKKGEQIMEQIAAITSPRDELKFILDTSLHIVSTQSDYQKLLLSMGLQIDQFPDLNQMVKERYQEKLPYIIRIMRDLNLEQPEVEAKLFIALLEGITLLHLVLGEAYPIDTMKEILYDKYLQV